MRSAILFLDTNILLDCPRAEDYRLPGRRITLVVIPEVMRELHGLSRAPGRGQAGPALLALATLRPLSLRPDRGTGVPFGGSGATLRLPLGSPTTGISTDRQLVLRARAERDRDPNSMVAVVTKDWGVAEFAREQRVKSILIRGTAGPSELERGLAEYDSTLDIDI